MSEETILEEALRLVHGPRQEAYGHPFDDFSRTGRIWGAILGLEDDVPPHLVALCLIGVKVSREVNAPKRDNRVDIAGYAETLELVRQREAADDNVIQPFCGFTEYDYDRDGLCPNCVTPWKCNGPHEAPALRVCSLFPGHVGPHGFADA